MRTGRKAGLIQYWVASTGGSPILVTEDLVITYDDAALGRLLQSIKTALRLEHYHGTQIFDRFYSDRPQTDAKRGKNSGLGLSISREIVVSHHGEIFAENRPPNGSASMSGARFTVRLPLIANVGDGLARRS